MRTLLHYQHTLLFLLAVLIFAGLLLGRGAFLFGKLPPRARIEMSQAAVADRTEGA